MDWSEPGIVLSLRLHGENAAIVTLLTAGRGRHVGLARGGRGSRGRPVWQPGNLVEASWRGRLEDHLGSYTAELLTCPAAYLLDDPLRLAALAAVCAVTDAALPEREPHEAVFQGLSALLDALSGEHWAFLLARYEISLLAELGFGLDLTSCAATGQTDQLAYVSPKSGRAVSLAAGEAYKDKLLRLPAFLLPVGAAANPAEPADMAAACAGLALSGFFLERHLFGARHTGLPVIRSHLLDRMSEAATISSSDTPERPNSYEA